MNTANWITLLVTVVGIAATWGGLLVRVKMVEDRARKTADDVASSREKQGERIGEVEKRIAILQERTRTRTRPAGVPIVGDAGDD